MKKADKEMGERKSKKLQAKRRKDEARKKEDSREDKKSKSVREMMIHWKDIDETSGSSSGNLFH